eukprot:TRINITY_DN13750_c0_g2_i1.p1 TRINITY_DN13750_c0_g2~~TRINITY_DN13750_c0_g2_i1.p1  ORF type:complete len:211 (+),score=-13.06 TRINITY_DN13750_c0_g2_i1:561-1193(+)
MLCDASQCCVILADVSFLRYWLTFITMKTFMNTLCNAQSKYQTIQVYNAVYLSIDTNLDKLFTGIASLFQQQMYVLYFVLFYKNAYHVCVYFGLYHCYRIYHFNVFCLCQCICLFIYYVHDNANVFLKLQILLSMLCSAHMLLALHVHALQIHTCLHVLIKYTFHGNYRRDAILSKLIFIQLALIMNIFILVFFENQCTNNLIGIPLYVL